MCPPGPYIADLCRGGSRAALAVSLMIVMQRMMKFSDLLEAVKRIAEC